MAGAAGWLSYLLGSGADDTSAASPSSVAIEPSDPNAPSSKDIEELLDEYEADLTRMNLVTLGRDYSLDDIKSYRQLARFGDPRKLYSVFDEMPRLGPGGQMHTATEAMKSARPQFITNPEDWDDDDNTPDDADPVDVANARAARDFLEDTFRPNLEELIEIHADEHWYGIADSKIVLDPRGNSGRWDSIAAVEGIPARRHRFDPTTHEWVLMLSPDAWNGTPVADLTLRPDSGTEGLFFTEIGAGRISLDQRGILVQCLIPWNYEQFLLRWSAKYVELYGIPPRIALVDFAHPNRVAEAKKALKTMGSTSYGVFQTGTDLKLLDAHAAGASDPFEARIDWCARQYDEKFLGHSQATGVQRGVGGKMQGDQAREIFQDLTNSRLRTFSTQLTRGPGKTLVARNFGADVAQQHSPFVKLRYVERDDPEILAKVALTLKQAGAGESVGVEDLVRRCALKLAAEGDKNLGAAAPAAGIGGGQGVTSGEAGMTGIGASAGRQALQAIANADSTEYLAIARVIAQYQEHEKKRALAFGRKKIAAVKHG